MEERIAVGQHLIAGFEGLSLSEDLVRAVREHRIGNFLLSARNIKSATQVKALCAEIQALVTQATGCPALIAISQEGGTVSRLSADCTSVPGAMAIAATGKPESARLAGRIIGQELRAMGVNFNLAPVFDINANPDNPVIGVRSYGDTPRQVIPYALEMARGLTDVGLICCAKHFPGHGDTDVDSHIGLPLVDKSLDELLAFELAPFQAAIDDGIPAVMSAHILFPKLEKERIPATLSRAIMTDLLRGRMGFKGLSLSDCMMMGAIADRYGTVNGIVEAVKAGVNLALVSHSLKLAVQASEQLLKQLRSGQMDATQLQASARLILHYKKRLKEPDASGLDQVGSKAHREAAQCLFEQALTPVHFPSGGLPGLGANPLFIGCLPAAMSRLAPHDAQALSFAREMQLRFGGTALDMSENPDAKEVARLCTQAPGHSCLVVGTCNGHLQKGQLALVRALSEGALPVICIALRDPYDQTACPPPVSGIAAYDTNAATLSALSRLLKGEIAAMGRLPVALKKERRWTI